MEIYKLLDLIELNDFGGDVVKYLDAIYEVFKQDFIDTKPTFRGIRLGLKRFPLVENKEYTFYHMTHDGDIEHDRTPDLRRMERIAWPRPMIDDSLHPYLKVWRNTRRGKGGTKKRILILHEEERYLVILEDRGKYILPWTAYLIKGKRQLAKHLNEYESYKKAEAAKKT